MIVPQIVYSVATNTCPRCHQGPVFVNSNPYSFKNGLTMAPACTCCRLKYERETGFFYGAMYVTYALTSGLFIVVYVADAVWIHLNPWLLFAIITGLILGLAPLTFRWGRLLWLNFFERFDKQRYGHRTGTTTQP